MGQQQPFGKLPQIIQAARKGDPRATQMLTRVRKAIDDALRSGHGPKGKPARRAKSAAPPIQTGFQLAKPTATLDVVKLGAAGTLYRSNVQAVKKAEIARRKAEVHKAHADMVRREKMARAHQIELNKKAKAHYKKLERGEKAMRKKLPKDEYARVKKLIAESERLQEEIRRLRAELGAKRR